MNSVEARQPPSRRCPEMFTRTRLAPDWDTAGAVHRKNLKISYLKGLTWRCSSRLVTRAANEELFHVPGVKGRSGGWNRLPIEDHILRGTYRVGRHGALAPAPVSPPAPSGPPPKPPKGLSRSSRAVWRRKMDEYKAWTDGDLCALSSRSRRRTALSNAGAGSSARGRSSGAS
jgi:hypothetical protein